VSAFPQIPKLLEKLLKPINHRKKFTTNEAKVIIVTDVVNI
jgi:hypothetical protein